MTSPTPPVKADVPTIAARLLQLAADALASPPTRRFRCIGTPVWDFGCGDQLAITVGPMQPGQPGEVRVGQYENSPNRLRSYTFQIELARCVPTADGGAPSQESLDASGARHMADYQALDRLVRSLGYNSKVGDDELRDAGVQSVAPGNTVTASPQGGMAAVRAIVTIVVA